MALKGLTDRLGRMAALGCLLLVTVAALQHRLWPLFSERVWARVSRWCPGLAFGYVMFDRVPSVLPLYRLSVDDHPVRASDVDDNSAFGYRAARFQINALLDPGYLRDVCWWSSAPFSADLMRVDLIGKSETIVRRYRCHDRTLMAVESPADATPRTTLDRPLP